ncbi:essential MCU regulator, mitochondrial [Episyrphus balteatus]|uniref:essential MCU regulator, mitochondrial n=1 Tax=Episyrphus balteatus TaxID=286459 RepID=UPI0024856F60|nr:essential MCU regulator, mitochondrial [Episyrphus balteatus]
MNASKIAQFNALRKLLNQVLIKQKTQQTTIRTATHYRSGALKPRPETMPLGLVGVMCAVIPGLFIGAAISKSVANFLEENELFVPADDDDDDED